MTDLGQAEAPEPVEAISADAPASTLEQQDTDAPTTLESPAATDEAAPDAVDAAATPEAVEGDLYGTTDPAVTAPQPVALAEAAVAPEVEVAPEPVLAPEPDPAEITGQPAAPRRGWWRRKA